MPRRIPHLAETILDKAAQLFSTKGYDAVDMKLVAAEAGTSVGNLYNYYKSKPDLFLAVAHRWRNNLVREGRAILGTGGQSCDRVLALLKRLYTDFASWSGILREFLGGREERTRMLEMRAQSGSKDGWSWGPDEQTLLAELESLLTGTASPQARWAQLVLMATVQVAKRHPEDPEGNLKFLEKLVDMICKEHLSSS